jgi:site-specific recombinase XerD
MNTVEPIRDEKKLEAIKRVLLGAGQFRDYLLFVMGINTGLRVSDLLNLRFSDVIDENGNIKDHIDIREQKTDKPRKFVINKSAEKALNQYMATLKSISPNAYIFSSRQGDNKPISRVRAWQVINDAARQVGITEQIGTHTLRKTFGYHAYRRGVPIGHIQWLFNHSAPSVTMRYLGITQDELDDVMNSLNL